MVLVNGDLLRQAAKRLEELSEKEKQPGVLLQDFTDGELVEKLRRAANGEQVD